MITGIAATQLGKDGIESSQTAPCKIAARPVLKKYCPESRRYGTVYRRELTKAFVNRTPSSAMEIEMTRLQSRVGRILELQFSICASKFAPIVREREKYVGTLCG